MSLLNVKCGIGEDEFTVHEPDTRMQGARFIAERAEAAGVTGFRALRKAMRRALDGETVTANGATYWIERF